MIKIWRLSLKKIYGRSSMSTLRAIKFFQDQQVLVPDITGREDEFICKDEPHFLGAEYGLGYNPLLPGSYYPGPSGHERVQILRKLGVGSTASIWMAAFTGTTSKMQERFGALKVLTTSVTNRILRNDDYPIYSPQMEPGLSSNPIVTCRSQPLPNFGLDPTLNNINVKVVDFGEALPLDEIPIGDVCQAECLRAPEVILGYHWSSSIDIWSLGCIAERNECHLQRMEELLGQFPSYFLERCFRRAEFFDDEGKLLCTAPTTPKTLEAAIAEHRTVNKNDVDPVAAFIRRCLTLDPAERPSAAELLKDEWLFNDI
ncbi:hypothetical protein H0H81_009577 [Sphagnurus paluster]|uniref:non-specific serine/threonine protein kinase n=1 Tax=Sphagnurus paluster TaxID=117069 RepID=A0A9P7FW84_9AGAR|nr:hypothetical protein H0H81_009577 [Sphagnurus paluster]